MTNPVALLVALTAPILAACPRHDGLVPVSDVQSALAARSVEIVRRGLAASDPAPDAMVAPDARFGLWDGDAGWGPRGKPGNPRAELRGVAAARVFAQALGAARFEAAVTSPGPIATDPCGPQSVTVTFEEPDGAEGYLVRFDYRGGRLVAADGRRATLFRGTIR